MRVPSPTATSRAVSDGETLSDVRVRRARFAEAERRLRAADSFPDPRTSDGGFDTGIDEWWREEVRAAAIAIDAVLRDHVRQTEGPNGLLADVLDTAPRLAGAVARLCNEHAQLNGAIGRLRWQVDRPDPVALRAATREVLDLLEVHRHTGADVLYEAYEVDVGTGD